MDFKKATDELFDPVTHDDLAKALGVSVATIRQARLDPAAKARRSPPGNWRDAAIRLAEQRALHYGSLAKRLRENRTEPA
jgi:hypothetical protein